MTRHFWKAIFRKKAIIEIGSSLRRKQNNEITKYTEKILSFIHNNLKTNV